MIQGEKLFDLVVRMQPQFRSSAHEIGNLLVGTPDGQQIPLSQLANINQGNGASFIYRENNSRYIGVQYSIEGRDLERAVHDGQEAVNKAVRLPQGYWMAWGGEYSQFLEAKSQMYFIGPLAVVMIFMILFALYGNFKFPVTIALGVIMTEPVGALVALKLTTLRSAFHRYWDCWPCWESRSRPPSFWFLTSTSCVRKDLDIRHGYSRGFAAALAPDHDDRSGRLSGSAASSTVDRHRLRHAEALRHRNRRRPDLPLVHRFLREPRLIRVGRAGRRRAADLANLGSHDPAVAILFGDEFA